MALVLQETLRGLFYAPFYAAMTLGAYEAEGVELRFTSAPKPADSARRLFSGEVDVSWGGPMRVMLTYEERADCDLVCFCEVVTRDPFLLIGRTPKPDFAFADLIGVRFASVSEVPTPWMCLQEDLRRAGIDPARLDRVADRGMAENAAALRCGEADVVQLFQPFAEEMIESGAGYLWYAAASRGPTSYTCFYARRATIERKRDELLRMTRAIYRTQKWIAAASGGAIAAAVERYFPDVPKTRLAAALARYQPLQIWGRDPRLPRRGYERLAESLISGGLIRAAPAYEKVVDNSFAIEAMRSQA
ncbi:MAG TPA: ABC transporter substrate-binding protein [Stellaceae bacterium]|nr:ABC transporter substrate-binding protein [Stellaceae bacterium]